MNVEDFMQNVNWVAVIISMIVIFSCLLTVFFVRDGYTIEGTIVDIRGENIILRDVSFSHSEFGARDNMIGKRLVIEAGWSDTQMRLYKSPFAPHPYENENDMVWGVGP